jgi:hypothetical protein
MEAVAGVGVGDKSGFFLPLRFFKPKGSQIREKY